MQGFRKIDSDRWEFANEEFLGGQRHLLKNIKRRRNMGSQNHPACCLELSHFGHETELQRLKRDHNNLMMEILKLRHQQQSSRAQLVEMEERMQRTERTQRQTMAFLAKATKNPEFIQQLLNRREQRRELRSPGKKRRLPASSSAETLFSAMSSEEKQRGEMLESVGENFNTISADFVWWDKLMNEELMVAGGGAEEGESSEIDVEVELAAEPSELGEEVKELVEQMEFLGSRQF